MFAIGDRVRVLRPYCLEGEEGYVCWIGRHRTKKVICISVALTLLDARQLQRRFMFYPDQIVAVAIPATVIA